MAAFFITIKQALVVGYPWLSPKDYGELHVHKLSSPEMNVYSGTINMLIEFVKFLTFAKRVLSNRVFSDMGARKKVLHSRTQGIPRLVCANLHVVQGLSTRQSLRLFTGQVRFARVAHVASVP